MICKLVNYLCVLSIVLCCNKQQTNVSSGNCFMDIDNACSWTPVVWVNNPNDSSVMITYNEKYGFSHIVFCKACFYNGKTKEYKLVSPGCDFYIQKDNITVFEIKKVCVID